jgi:RNA polymerase sigma factor (sigma-70 family)
MRYVEPAAPLVAGAVSGNESAWRDLLVRYGPLIRSVCHRFGVVGADADDIAGSVWLRTVDKLTALREPEALPGWLSTMTSRECVSVLRHNKRQIPTDLAITGEADDQDIARFTIAEEQRASVRDAVAQLSERDQALLSMLFSDPPIPYARISAALGIPVGAIGPTRARCLARLRRTSAISALLRERPLGRRQDFAHALPSEPDGSLIREFPLRIRGITDRPRVVRPARAAMSGEDLSRRPHVLPHSPCSPAPCRWRPAVPDPTRSRPTDSPASTRLWPAAG